jgi:hypothetical protein
VRGRSIGVPRRQRRDGGIFDGACFAIHQPIDFWMDRHGRVPQAAITMYNRLCDLILP